jgi:DNA-binding NtrC family response regulator
MAKRQVDEERGRVSVKGQDRKLLLVDEDTNDLEYYAEVLRHLGYEVRPVESYARAAATLGSERFDLVIVEQGSTDFEGRSVLTRAVEVDRHVPVLVLTRMVDVGCCVDALNAGASEYVQKPLTPGEVRELVSDYVECQAEKFSASRAYELPKDFVGVNTAESGSLRKVS